MLKLLKQKGLEVVVQSLPRTKLDLIIYRLVNFFREIHENMAT